MPAASNPPSPFILPPPLNLTRTFAAPRPLVFAAWTDAKHLANWWGPKCFTNPVCEIDFRPGGAIRIHMQGPDGTVYPMGGSFLEISPTTASSSPPPPSSTPRATQASKTSTPSPSPTQARAKPLVTVRAEVQRAHPSAANALSCMSQGWSQSLDKLGEFVITL